MNVLIELFMGKPFEIESTYPIDETPQKLQKMLDKENLSFVDRLRDEPDIVLEIIDPSTYQYTYQQTIIGDYQVFCRGHIIQSANHITIKGKVIFSRMVRYAPILFLLFYVVAQAFAPPEHLLGLQLFILCVYSIFTVIFIFAWKESIYQYQLIHRIFASN